ncbi:hypothetical protein JM18_003981 [Phytophthora kernoviae]|uniref:Phosphatidate cytidylyltransferase n=1 Tax=Phytophthora kernoviae TaxID=325452 RepID=A0A8T0M6P5_9STRA|nr:hypothetical protein JM18_003981 [Phytophthora kernoviae]KAG2528714.1 hypothetical protein JM16_002531 [Phytophthora kernoviae]
MSMMGLRPVSDHPVLGNGGGMFDVPNISMSLTDAPPDPEMELRPSSVAMLRGEGMIAEEDPSKPSWMEEEAAKSLTCAQQFRIVFDSLLLLVAAGGIAFASYWPVDIENGMRYGGVLPYIYAVFVAIAGYEFAWLSYRVQLRLYLPFKLHEKQTSREMYRQIISYAVDGETLLAAGAGVGLCFIPGFSQMPMIYVGVSAFVGTFSAALAPNTTTAVCVLIRYAYFFLSSLNFVLRSDLKDMSTGSGDDGGAIVSRQTMDKYLAVVVESYSLLLLGVALLLLTRAVTSKDAVESAVMIVLDVAGLLYISSTAAVLELFAQSPRVRGSGALAGFFMIVWSAELGAFLTERIMKSVDFPWMHPLSKYVSSQQNFEKLLGAMVFAIGATFVAANFVEFDMGTHYVALLSACAVVCAHFGKLFLVSLKKIAKVSRTGSYLRVGGGVLDRMDTLLFMTVVFAPFFQRAIYQQPQW